VQRVITKYEQVVRTERVPLERLVQDYYVVDYQAEYVPRIIEEKVIDYVQQKRSSREFSTHLTKRILFQLLSQVVHCAQETAYDTAGYGVGAVGVSIVGVPAVGSDVSTVGVAPATVQETITTTTSGPGPYPGTVGVGYGGVGVSGVGLGGISYGRGYGVGVPPVGVSGLWCGC
jgi:hypothetical protein